MENTSTNNFYEAILTDGAGGAPNATMLELMRLVMTHRIVNQRLTEFIQEFPRQLNNISPTASIDSRIEEAVSALHNLGLDDQFLEEPTNAGQKPISTPIVDIIRQYKTIQDDCLRENSVNQTLAALRAARLAGYKVDTLSEPVDSFFTRVNVSLGDLYGIHERLLERHWIEPNCTKDCFTYFFSGVGNPPFNRIGWLESNVLLALFIKEVTNDRKKWVKVCRIFELWNPDMSKYEPVKYDSIRANASNAVLYDAYLSNLEMVRQVIKGK